MKKKIIISITAVLLVLIVGFLFMQFNIVGKLYSALFKGLHNIAGPDEVNPEDNPEEFKYVTEKDKDGNEFVVEYQRKYLTSSETGEKVEVWLQTEHSNTIFDYNYYGTIEKIEDNKIYCLINAEGLTSNPSYKDVEDYEIVFDIDTFDFEKEDENLGARYFSDGIYVGNDKFYRVSQLEELMESLKAFEGKYCQIHYYEFEDPYTGDRSLGLDFWDMEE